MQIQEAKKSDIKDIQGIEKEYYEGYSCPMDILKEWIEKNKKSFLVARDGKRGPIAFLFFETVKKIEALPFIHKPQDELGQYLYISEVGVLDKYIETDVLYQLFKELLKRSKEKKGITWVTGGKSKHDKIELKLIKSLGFKRLKKVNRWEAYPGHFVGDHWVWFRELKKETQLVSACLVGIKCNYMGGCFESCAKIRELFEKGELFPVCPEVLGGLPVPRFHTEIQGGDGEDVLKGKARVIWENGKDVTNAFIKGAHMVLETAKVLQAKKAIFKFISPSCGCGKIYDGTFSRPSDGKEHPEYFKDGNGVTTALLKRHGVKIITEKDI